MKLLITGAWKNAENNIKLLEDMGHQVLFLQNEQSALPCQDEWIEGIVCNGFFLYHPIEKFPNLKYIQLTSVGTERIPIEYIKDNNIQLKNAGSTYSVPMAEFVLSSVLQLYKKHNFFYDNQKKHNWKKNRQIMELYKKMFVLLVVVM